ncbi:MAG: hypothetical protein AB1340_06010 [Pseudomonadota bacterium]
MITFKTQFPLNANKDIDDLIEAGRVWIAGSPHSKLANSLRKTSNIGDDWHLATEFESILFARHENGKRLCALRYENIDESSVRWVTEIAGAKDSNEFWVSIQLSVDSELPLERIEQGKRPHILKTIMRDIGGGMDGRLPVSDKPIVLDDSAEGRSLAVDVITAHAGCIMPVVYVSADNHDSPHIDAPQLSQWLSGMAHVIVEPTRAFSFDLMPEVLGENAYGGAVAIYWPDGIGKWLFLPHKEYEDPKQMQIAIARKVRLSLLSQRSKRECTWSHIQELKSKQRIRELKESGSNRVDDYIAAFDTELESKNEEIQRLEQEVNRLKYGASNDAQGRNLIGGAISLGGREKDLYQGERLCILLDALSSAVGSTEPHSRRRMVLEDMIEANTQEGQRESILSSLKEVLRSYTAMNGTIRSELERLGFEISEEGKHYKLSFRGDKRYPFILPKTGSDHRGGLNAFSDLKKRLF